MQIDGYRVHRLLHDGYFGPVLQADDAQTGQRVAIQVFNGPFRGPQASLQGLQDHFQTLHILNLPGIPAPLRCGELADRRLFLASQWIEGRGLPAGPPSPADALRWTQQLAACLATAHRHGIDHLNLRPSQILIGSEGGQPRCYLLGLGLTRLFGRPDAAPGPAAPFRAPETHSKEGTAAADVYGLGALLRALLGKGIVAGEAAAQPREGPVPVIILERLGTLAAQMTATEPGQRPAMSEVNAQLYRLARHRSMVRRVALDGRTDDWQGAPLRPLRALPADASADSVWTMTAKHEQPPPERREAARDPLIGQLFGKFRLLKRLGGGGMGTVYEARHELIGHRAAVKVLHPQLGSSKEYARRFVDEARAVNIVGHPSLVSVFDCGQREDGRLYMVMELLSGRTLDDAMTTWQKAGAAPLRESEAVVVMLQLARALAVSHARGIVHRDLKPSNIMLVSDELAPDSQRVKILDFGIAKLSAGDRRDDHTQADMFMGTPAYMAPEQYGGAKDVDGKADVFSLGIVCFEMIAGASPFGERSTYAVRDAPPPRLRTMRRGVSRTLDRLIAATLSAEPADRPSMAEVVRILSRLQARRALRKRLVPAGVALVVAALGAVIWVVAARPPSLAKLEQRQDQVRARASAALRDALSPRQPAELRALAAKALGSTRDPGYREWLVPLLQDPELHVATTAAEALGALGDEQAGPALRALLERNNEVLSIAAARALAQLPVASISEPGRTYLHRLLDRFAGRTEPELLALQVRAAAQLYAAGDVSYAEPLRGWVGNDRAALSLEERLDYLEQLAHDPGPELRRLLLAMGAKLDEDRQLEVLASLQRLGLAEEAERERLLATAQQEGPHRTIAAWLLAHGGDGSFCQHFVDVVREPKQDFLRKQLAVEGLSRCGFRWAQALLPLLDEFVGDPELPVKKLRVLSAGSLLRVVGPKPERIAERQWQLVQSLLRSDQSADYGSLIRLLEASPNGQSVEILGQLLKPGVDLEVRKAAAAALGAKQLRTALSALAAALEDANEDVRETGMRAILRLLKELAQPAGSGLSASALSRLQRLVATPVGEREQLIARLLLMRYGYGDQLKPLSALMERTEREDLRLLIVELAEPNSPLIRKALTDQSSVRVRFFAARRRFEVRGADAVPVLQEMLTRRGPEAVLAYWMLRRMTGRVKTPPRLGDLLARGADLATRIDIVRILAELPVGEALPLLAEASTDPAEMVRREVVLAAVAQYRVSRDPRLIDLLNRLMSDPEPLVRYRAQTLLTELVMAGRAPSPQPPPQPTSPIVGPSRPKDASAEAPDLPPSTGSATVVTTPVAPMLTEIETQARSNLKTARALILQGKKEEALRLLNLGLRNLKGKVSDATYYGYQWERGNVYGAKDQLALALTDYNAIWDHYHGSPPAPMSSIKQKFSESQIHGKVGRLDIYRTSKTGCVLERSMLVMGGQNTTIFNKKGTFEVKVPPGQTQPRGECTPNPAPVWPRRSP